MSYSSLLNITAAMLAHEAYDNFLGGAPNDWHDVPVRGAALPIALEYDQPWSFVTRELQQEADRQLNMMKAATDEYQRQHQLVDLINQHGIMKS